MTWNENRVLNAKNEGERFRRSMTPEEAEARRQQFNDSHPIKEARDAYGMKGNLPYRNNLKPSPTAPGAQSPQPNDR